MAHTFDKRKQKKVVPEEDPSLDLQDEDKSATLNMFKELKEAL